MGYLDLDGLQYLWGKLKEKFAAKSHTHDDRYYTESEMDGKLASKVNNTEDGANGLLSKLPTTQTAAPTDDTYFIRQDISGISVFGRLKFSTLWTYIKGKADSVYQPKGSYAASDHNHDSRYYTESEINTKLANKAESIVLSTSANLNSVTTPGIYSCGGGNAITNKPSGVDAIGLIVTHNATGAYYTQILTTSSNSNTYRRTCLNDTWSAWTQDKYTDTNTWRGIQDNLTSDSATDSLSAKQGKALKALVDGKAASGHIHLNGTKTGDIDQNTLTTHGTYKIQNCNMTADYHAPVNEYAYGILEVIDGEGNTGEHRLLQIYHPHNTTGMWYRMNNASAGYTAWTSWVKLAVKPATAGTADVANSVDWSKVQNKPSTYTPAAHEHDLSTMINKLSAGTATPTDADYYVSQYAGGGTTTTTYHRRPMSSLWAYIKGKADGTYAAKSHTHSYLPLSGGTVTGVTSFTNTTASTNKSTGAVKISGGLGVAGRMSANEVMIGDGCTLMYNSTNKCVDFIFS